MITGKSFTMITKLPKLRRGTKTYRALVREARRDVAERIVRLNRAYGYPIGKVAIRKQKSRWGSCSRKGNLNFNVRMIFLPEHVRDYIIVHELCHLGEFNHSKAFWELVAKTVPDVKAIRRDLRTKYLL